MRSIIYFYRTLRKLFKVDPADYMLSICGDNALRELSSPGKSGSFFYLTSDDRYMIKTVKKSEVKVNLLTSSPGHVLMLYDNGTILLVSYPDFLTSSHLQLQ